MYNVLISGAGGFLGRNTVDFLKAQPEVSKIVALYRTWKELLTGWEQEGIETVKVADLGDPTCVPFLKETICKHNINTVIHLAANPLVKESTYNPTLITKDNVLATHNLLAAAADRDINFIFSSTGLVYNFGHKTAAREWRTLEPASIYENTKLFAEDLITQYYNQGRLSNFYNFRLLATVGPHLTHGVIFDFIRKLRSPDKCLDMFGEYPGSSKPFTHTSDVIGAFWLAVQRKICGGVYNVSNEDTISVDEIADLVMDAVGVRKEKHWLGNGANWKNDKAYVQVSSSRLRKAGWVIQYPTSQLAIKKALGELV